MRPGQNGAARWRPQTAEQELGDVGLLTGDAVQMQRVKELP